MPDRENVIEGLEMSYKYSNVDESNTLVPQQLVLDAIALLKAQEPVVMAGAELTDAELIEEIRKAPIVLKPNVDATPVVRCRDCKYSDVIYDTTSDTMPLKCLNIRYGGVRPEWFCEHGERRDEGADN